MDFKKILHKLKYCNRFNGSLLSKKIISNIQDVTETELTDILDLIHDSADMEYQVKLISILTAYLLLNNSNRDVIIKSTFLYGTLCKILTRGLPLKTAITLNFITCVLYTEDDEGTRSRTLTLHAQNLIRNSGCLTAMTQMFMNPMLLTETLQALCRCLAEACRGSEPNQNFCSHLVPLCVQRCLQGNPDVFPVLQSLLSNHKRNTNLFMDTNGAAIFNRKDYFRLEGCLQLLNTVVQNAEVAVLSTMSSGIHKNLNELLKTSSDNFVRNHVVQWTTIISYHLGSKLKKKDNCYNGIATALNHNIHIMDSNLNDTQILLRNIMSEIISNRNHIPLNNFSKAPDKLSHVRNASFVGDIQNMYKNKRFNSPTLIAPSPIINDNVSQNERLSFSFLKDKSFICNSSNCYNKSNNYRELNVNQTLMNNKGFNQRIEEREYSKLDDTFEVLINKCENMIDFKPSIVSTPKRSNKMHSIIRSTSTKTSIKELNHRSKNFNRRTIKKVPKRRVSEEKHKSMSSRIFEAINESCTTVIRSVKNVFAGNKTSNVPKQDADMKSVKEQKSYCSYSFTNYMHKREAGLMEHEINKDVSSEMNTQSTLNLCNTCDNTVILQHKLASNEQLKATVQKLKLGINLYGCDFKRISKTMWPRETYMTPNVLYNLYRKLLLK